MAGREPEARGGLYVGAPPPEPGENQAENVVAERVRRQPPLPAGKEGEFFSLFFSRALLHGERRKLRPRGRRRDFSETLTLDPFPL